MLPVEITARGVTLGAAEEADLRERIYKLETLYERVVSCHALVEVPGRHQRAGRVYSVRLDISVPGGELVVNHKPRDSLRSAVQGAFDAAERQLKEYARRRRGEVEVEVELFEESVRETEALEARAQVGDDRL